MKTIKIGKTIAIAIAVLGGIHNIATFTPIIKGTLSCLPTGILKFVLYANIMCGSFFIITGIMMFMLFNKYENNSFLIKPISILTCFLLISGILLIIFSENIFDNPFAVISVLLDIAVFGINISLLTGKKHQINQCN
jgi:hypothetical protein